MVFALKKIEKLEKKWIGKVITLAELDEDMSEDKIAWDAFVCPYIRYLELGAASVAVYDEADREETGIEVICAKFDVLDMSDKNIDVEDKDDVAKLGNTQIKITDFYYG